MQHRELTQRVQARPSLGTRHNYNAHSMWGAPPSRPICKLPPGIPRRNQQKNHRRSEKIRPRPLDTFYSFHEYDLRNPIAILLLSFSSTMKFVTIAAALPIAMASTGGVASPDTDAIVKTITSPRFLQRNSRKLMVSEQCTSEIEALFDNQDFVGAVIDFESSLMGQCNGAIQMS